MPDTKKKPAKRKIEYVNEIVARQLQINALSDSKTEWNEKNLLDKTTIPNLKNIISLQG